MQSRTLVEWISHIDLDRWLYLIHFLRPIDWNGPTMLNKTRVSWIIVHAILRIMKTRSHHITNNLLCFNLICNIASIIDASFEKPCTCKMVRSPGYNGDVEFLAIYANIGLIYKAVHNRLKPLKRSNFFILQKRLE